MNSLENRVYKEFMDFELGYEAEVMSVYGKLYPRRDGVDTGMLDRYNELQWQRESFMDSLSGRYPDLYAVRLMNAFRAPIIPGEISHLERIDTLKECFFDRVPIDDPALLHAPVYTFKLIDYLSLYKDNTLTKEEQESAFTVAVDRIMVNVSPDSRLREFVVGYLLEGFEMLGMEQVQMHLAGHYLDERCESDIVELVRSRMEGYKKMTTGKKAPDIVLRDVKGITHQLSELDHSYVLVLFWASTCEHCREMLPGLREWYLNENSYDLEVLAISIDSSEADFTRACQELDLPWIIARDPLGWQGRASSDYYVYATPIFYLLDRERNILARPSGIRQLLRSLRKLEH
jgi:peroxiredoxin